MTEHEDFERELRSLTPRGLSESAKDSIAARLDDEAKGARPLHPRRRHAVMAVLAAAAVLLAIGAALLSRNVPVTPVGSRPSPPEAEKTLSSGIVRISGTEERYWDEGTFLLGDDMPVRRVRRQLMKHVLWRDFERDITMEMTLPGEEEVMLVRRVKY